MTLPDLFDDKSQLIIYHFMFGPEWQEGCPSCSFNMDNTDGALVHLAQRDVSFAAISRASYPKLAAFKKRMGWRFNQVSSNANDFNRDYHVAFTKQELAKGQVEYNYSMGQTPKRGGPREPACCYNDANGEAAKKRLWLLPCRGFAITIVTRTATWRIWISRTGLRTLCPQAEYLSALERLRSVVVGMTTDRDGN